MNFVPTCTDNKSLLPPGEADGNQTAAENVLKAERGRTLAFLRDG